jgi:hypothetical protein
MNRYYVKKPDLQLGNRAARMMRLVAKAIDLILALFITILFYPFGPIFAAIFISIMDAANKGESVGKKILGFAVLNIEDRKPCTMRASIIRNLPISVPFVFLAIPYFGVIIFLLIMIPVCLLECYFIFRLDSYHRLGDILADTTVIADDPTSKVKGMKNWFSTEPSAQPEGI